MDPKNPIFYRDGKSYAVFFLDGVFTGDITIVNLSVPQIFRSRVEKKLLPEMARKDIKKILEDANIFNKTIFEDDYNHNIIVYSQSSFASLLSQKVCEYFETQIIAKYTDMKQLIQDYPEITNTDSVFSSGLHRSPISSPEFDFSPSQILDYLYIGPESIDPEILQQLGINAVITVMPNPSPLQSHPSCQNILSLFQIFHIFLLKVK
jgi:hypothetical protein